MPEQTEEGRKGGHKGRARQYTSPEEIDAQLQAEKQKARDEEEEQEEGDGATGDPKKKEKSLESDESEEEDDEEYQPKHKGVEGMIDIENPNRVAQTTKKVTQIDLEGPRELSRREREEIEKQKAKERYMKMHLAGKTEQAKADLARLAIIRKQREEAARKKEEERKAKDEAASAGKRLCGEGGSHWRRLHLQETLTATCLSSSRHRIPLWWGKGGLGRGRRGRGDGMGQLLIFWCRIVRNSHFPHRRCFRRRP
uniref:PDGFA associated protein 1 n=1 Tax=Salvator merianae TaxID=96440 RepID=A0A8D0E3V8_SALMN